MELADVADSKSAGSDTVPVRLRPAAPAKRQAFFACRFFFWKKRTRLQAAVSLSRKAQVAFREMARLRRVYFYFCKVRFAPPLSRKAQVAFRESTRLWRFFIF